VRDFSFEELTKENARSKDGSTMQALRSLALGLARAAIWPLYLVLLAYASRVAPWPRSLGILVSAVLTGAAIAIFIHELLRLLTRPSGWSERNLDVPAAVARQLGWDCRFVVMAALVFLLPVYLLNHELIAPEGKSITAPALCRLLVLGFELFVWGACVRWFAAARRSWAGSRFRFRLRLLVKHRTRWRLPLRYQRRPSQIIKAI
jgi:hypothetical protein